MVFSIGRLSAFFSFVSLVFFLIKGEPQALLHTEQNERYISVQSKLTSKAKPKNNHQETERKGKLWACRKRQKKTWTSEREGKKSQP